MTRAEPGSLAGRLFAAEDALLSTETELEELLDSLYNVGGADGERQWQGFEHDRALALVEVYGVVASPAAADALYRAGFAAVLQHHHEREQFVHCACRRWEPVQ